MFAFTIHENNNALAGHSSTKLRGGADGASLLKMRFPFATHVPLAGISVGDGWCGTFSRLNESSWLSVFFYLERHLSFTERCGSCLTTLGLCNTVNLSSACLRVGYFHFYPFFKLFPCLRKGFSVGFRADPPTMIGAYADLMYNTGLVDANQKAQVQSYVDNMTAFIAEEDWYNAYLIWDAMLNGDLTPYPTFWENATGPIDYFNTIRDASPAAFGYFNKYVTLPNIRKAIHVGDSTFHSGLSVELHLIPDVMQTMKPELAVVMTHYKTLIYSGSLDVIIGGPLTERFLPTVQWPGQEEYIAAPRTIWRYNGLIAGYARQVQNLTQLIVRRAGHILPYDQPAVALEMLTRFIEGDVPFGS